MRFRRRITAVAFLCAALACGPGYGQEQPRLGDTIREYAEAHPCTEGRCRNPVFVVRDEFIQVIRFDLGLEERSEIHLTWKEVRPYLEHLPLSAWPQGPRAWVRDADFHIFRSGSTPDQQNALRRQQMMNSKAIMRAFEDLGLTPTDKGGTSLETKVVY